jgi:hypothetical protein
MVTCSKLACKLSSGIIKLEPIRQKTIIPSVGKASEIGLQTVAN